ncbi:MAG: class I SAM-dependent methyltransferase [Spirochaetes bacterium]|nr:class I SAM-dependent methyltransferase [Spirochaetota bacterium]
MKAVFDKKKDHCPLCLSKNIGHHYKINRSEYIFSTDRCSDCGFIFMNPKYSDSFTESFYTEKYYEKSADYSYFDERKTEKYCAYVWKSRIRNIRKYVKEGSFIDIGCSFGLFLKYASKYFKTYGIEISKHSSDYAKKNSNSIIENISWDKYVSKIKFNCVTMIEVIEHVSSPREILSKVYDMLDTGGIAVIQTADMEAHQAIDAGENYHYYLPGHLSYFSERNLSELLLSTGFKKVKVFRPVDFPLYAKLLKSRGEFNKISDYKKWIQISLYHFKGYFKRRRKPLTSSMVIYAFK